MKSNLKKLSVKILVVLLIVVLVVSFTGCNKVEQETIKLETGVYAYTVLDKINDGFSQRIAGTKNEKIMAEYIYAELKSFGYDAVEQPFSYEKTDKTTKVVTSYNSQNIVATKKSKVAGAKTIIIGAHYDSVSAGKGVDDNGSGVAVLLEVAKHYFENNSNFNLTFVFFGAEEVGLQGSKYYVNNMSAADKTGTELMVNLDSLAGGDIMYVYGGVDSVSKSYMTSTLKYSKDNKLDIITQAGLNADYAEGTTGDWSDHSPFKYEEIPFLYFEATNWNIKDADGNYTDGYVQVQGELLDYAIMHTAQDNLDYLNAAFSGRVLNHMISFVKAVINVAK